MDYPGRILNKTAGASRPITDPGSVRPFNAREVKSSVSTSFFATSARYPVCQSTFVSPLVCVNSRVADQVTFASECLVAEIFVAYVRA